MNKQQLIDNVAEKTGASKKQAGEILSALIEIVSDAIATGDDVQLVGFGTFKKVKRAARTMRNPKTGETMQKGESFAPKFVPGQALKNACK